jgi:hypothetical protein
MNGASQGTTNLAKVQLQPIMEKWCGPIQGIAMACP